MPGELVNFSLNRVAKMIEQREVSSVEVTELALERTERLNPLLNAFITVVSDRALSAAHQADIEISKERYRGPLHGIPYSLKDIVETRHIPTTAGSPILRRNIPESDATVYERLSAAGGVLLGKNTLHQFAYGAPHEDFGFTRNPWNPEYSAAGSSSGSAVAVAGGMGYGSIGSDTGGSIRIPSAWCGLFGLKPTYGRVSLKGVVPMATSLDHIGPMTRTARDAAIMLQYIAGHDPHDPYSSKEPVPDYVACLDEPLPNPKIGIDYAAMDAYADSEIVQAVRSAAEIIQGFGTRLANVTLPNPAHAVDTAMTMIFSEAAEFHQNWLNLHPESYSSNVRIQLMRGLESRAVDYIRAQRERQLLRSKYDLLFKSVDFVLTPTSIVNPITIDVFRSELERTPESPVNSRMLFTNPINLIGFPAISVPCGITSSGLPVGMQIIGRPMSEATLLSLAERFERETEWAHLHPDL